MSKRKPKAKRPTYGEQHVARLLAWWPLPSTTNAGTPGKGSTVTVKMQPLIDRMKAEDAALKARWNDEVIGPRAVPDDCPRAAVLSIARAADILGVEGKSDRFIARFIATGIIAANKEGRQRWKFDLDELDRVAIELEDEAKAARKRRSLR